MYLLLQVKILQVINAANKACALLHIDTGWLHFAIIFQATFWFEKAGYD
jgi:hypothetical protein